ncbi:MAG: DUF5020 family protein [Chlorobi bacterium]|nr:DUF5020 family protein [Chlorobiota bacterium]
MKSHFSLFILLLAGLLPYNILAQNVQLHYDYGKDRKMFTSTVEMFKPDKMGSTFFFIDMDYGSKASGVDGMNHTYWEIARSFKAWQTSNFEPRVEFNGGFGRGQYKDADGNTVQFNYSINSAWLLGIQYTFATKDFTKTLTLQANYKYINDKNNTAFQLTAVWGFHFFDKKLSLTGFADWWREDNIFEENTTNFVFLTEPQIWWNAMEHFSLGGEFEMSNNFANNEGFMLNPTIAVKWIL